MLRSEPPFCAVKEGVTPNSCGKNHTPPKRGVDNAVEKWITGVTEKLQNAGSCKDRAVAPLGSPVQGELAFAKQMTEGLSVAAQLSLVLSS